MTSAQPARKLDPRPTGKRPLAGLCTTCMHAESCMYPRDDSAPILFCEEFEVVSAPTLRVIEKDEKKPMATSGLKGLCSNCSNAATCKFPKPESGVWHCEEYA